MREKGERCKNDCRYQEREKPKKKKKNKKTSPEASEPKLEKAETRSPFPAVQPQPSFVSKASFGKERFWMNRGSLASGMKCFHDH